MKRLLFIAGPLILTFASATSAQHSQSAKKYVKQGLERFDKNDITGAIAAYDRAISLDPGFADAYLNRGKAKRAAGTWTALLPITKWPPTCRQIWPSTITTSRKPILIEAT